MARALGLARIRLGRTAPNPAVGCVIVAEGVVVGEGMTGVGGRPHAEEVALLDARGRARGACAYVTLEPCNARRSARRSCSELLIDAGVRRVVLACEDPHALAADGVLRLRAAGVEVVSGLMRAEAEALNAGFLKVVRTGRPWLAIDADASIYDGPFDLRRGESFEEALDRLGREGLTRVCIAPGAALASQLKARGLIDEDCS